jgi:hypothetical protein
MIENRNFSKIAPFATLPLLTEEAAEHKAAERQNGNL